MNVLINSDPTDEECDGEGGGRGWLSNTDQITYENISRRGQCNGGVKRSRRMASVSGTGEGNPRDRSQSSYMRHEATAFGQSGCGFGDDMLPTERKGIQYAE